MTESSQALEPSAAPTTPAAPPPTDNAASDFRTLLRGMPPVVVACMVVGLVGMNLLANKSLHTGVSWLALDGGILFSWIIFLSMDVMTKCFGPRASTIMSLVALAINWVVAFVFFLASLLPGEWSASYVPGSEAVLNAAFDETFRGAWFIILGSSVAFVVSALINNYLNAGIGRRLAREGHDSGFGAFATRSYVSTFLAQVADNLVFALLVSQTFFGWTLAQCISCALTGAVLELLFEVVFSPIGYRVAHNILVERAKGQAAGQDAAGARFEQRKGTGPAKPEGAGLTKPKNAASRHSKGAGPAKPKSTAKGA